MKNKLLELSKLSTAIVEKNNYTYYWELDGYKFNNLYLARWYEKEFDTWVNFVARDFDKFKNQLKDKTLDMSHNYDLDFVRKIRKDHDYVRLLFSGGYDSTAVFLQFVENNIYIDETLSILPIQEDHLITNEVIQNAGPMLEKYKKHIGKQIYFQTTDNHLIEQWSDEYAFFTIPTGNAAPTEAGSYQFYHRPLPYIKKGCNIKCIDKPQIVYYKNKWYVTAVDSILGSWVGLPNLIYFWLDANNIKGLIKHARLYRDYLVENNQIINEGVQFFKFYAQDELNYVIQRPEICNPDQKINKFDKRHHQKTYFINSERWDIYMPYTRCLNKFIEIFPETAKGFKEFNSKGKFAWLVDIDNLEIFTQQELIPDGFDAPPRM